jgi:hypothetical protein
VCKVAISSIAQDISLMWTHRIGRATVRSDLRPAVMLLRFPIRSLQAFLLMRGATLLLAVAIPSLGSAQSATQVTTTFKFAREVNWGGAVLPPGDYVISVSSDHPPLITVSQKGGTFVAKIAPKTVSTGSYPGNLRMVTIEDESRRNYVSSLYLEDSGTMLLFGAPNPSPQARDADQDAAEDTGSGDASSGDRGSFTIHSLGKQKVPYAEVQAIYLSACRMVAQEFSRTDPVRPPLTLVLGTDADGVYYLKREIQLKKWDKYEFAEGVVMMAVADLLPRDKKLSLARLAVLEAETTVDVSELKTRRSFLPAAPAN